VPLERLLKMPDASGYLLPQHTLTSTALKAVVWAPSPWLATHIRGALAEAGIEALHAAAFRDVAKSLGAVARPTIALAVVQLAALGEPELAQLAAARWAGYTGTLVGVGTRYIAPRTRLRLGLEVVSGAMLHRTALAIVDRSR
jgi:hypothetical protein